MSRFNAALWRTLSPFFTRYRWVIGVALVALLCGAAANLTLGRGIEWMVDDGFAANSHQALRQAIGTLGLIVVVMAASAFVRFYAVTWLGERVAADLREAVFAKLLLLDASFYEGQKSGNIMSQLTTDTTLLQSIIGSSFSFALRAFVTAIGAMVMMFITNPLLSSFVIVGVPVVLLPILVLGRRMRRLSRQSQETVAEVGSYAGEIVRQIKTVKAFGREVDEKQAFHREVNTAFDVAKRRILNRSVLMAVVMLLAFSVIATMIYFGGRAVIAGDMSPGALTAFLFYAVMLASATAGVSEVIGELQRAAGAAERIAELLLTEQRIAEGNEALTPQDGAAHVQFEAVDFFYPNRETQVFSGLSFDIPRGKTTAIVGPSGAGKSTLFELLLRFYTPSAGQIKLSGQAIDRLSLAELRQHFAWVPQTPVLFTGNVRDNLRYGRPEASDEALWAVAEQANAKAFIEALPHGLDSRLGEAGTLLSAGQKQRIAIARALLTEAEILLLDEATSALDSRSEQWVQSGLAALREGRTTLVIAHRLSTVIDADLILVMDQGKIVAKGTHQALMQDSALYRELATLQLQSAETFGKNALGISDIAEQG